MATYQTPTSPVLSHLITPLADAYSGSLRKYDCKEISELDFLEFGISRCISAVTSGRDFLQQHGDSGRKDIERTFSFKALKSPRRRWVDVATRDLHRREGHHLQLPHERDEAASVGGRATLQTSLGHRERKRKSEREEKAKESDSGYVAMMIQRFTVRSVKFVR